MLQRDYIQRLIREFTAALRRILEKKETGERQQEMRRLFTVYMGDYEFFHTATLDDIMRWAEKYPEEERLWRISMLAELYNAEADLLSEPMRTAQLGMAYMLFDFTDRHSGIYSPDRLRKMNRIKKMTSNNNGCK